MDQSKYKLYNKIVSLEKKVVIIDIGNRYTKFGISGDLQPRCIIPTAIKDKVTGQPKNVFNYKNLDELYNNLVEFFHYLYFKRILLSPKDTKVIIVESLLTPIQLRETLAKVLFCHLQISSLLMVPSHMVALYTLAIPTALVMDIGHEEACLIPVFEGYPVLHAYQSFPLAGRAIENNLKKLLIEHYEKEDPSKVSLIESLPEKTLEDIKVRLCFVTTLERSQKLLSNEEVTPPPSVNYRIGGTQILTIPGKIRESACEVLFYLDADAISLSTMILNVLIKMLGFCHFTDKSQGIQGAVVARNIKQISQKGGANTRKECATDMKRCLSENILLIGGTASLPGIKSRLLSELKHLVTTPKYKEKLFVNDFKIHKSPSHENYTAWLGGSLVGVTEMVNLSSITKDEYKAKGDIPDWASLKYNTKEEATAK